MINKIIIFWRGWKWDMTRLEDMIDEGLEEMWR